MEGSGEKQESGIDVGILLLSICQAIGDFRALQVGFPVSKFGLF